ncbi:hypothetical protein ACLBXB_14390, partial [Methylobacterium mesophilicum]
TRSRRSIDSADGIPTSSESPTSNQIRRLPATPNDSTQPDTALVKPVAPITMPPERLPKIQITALRACGYHPQGLRHSAHLKTMCTLQGLGYVEERAPHLGRDLRWFLNPGRARAADEGRER